MNKLNKKILPGIVIVFALFFCATPSKVHAQAQMFPPGTFPPGTPACVTADTNTPVNIDWSLGLPGQPYAGDKGYSNNSVQVGWGDGAGGTYALDNGSYYGSAAHMTHTWTTPGDYIFSGQGPGWGGCGQQSCSGGAVAGTMTGNTGSASGAPTVCYAIIRAPLPNLPPNVPTCLTGVPNTSYTFTYQGYNQYYDPNGTVTISFWDNGSWSPFSAPTDAAPGGGQTKTISHAWSWATPGSYLVKGEGPSGGGSSCNNSGGCTANGSSGSGPLTGPTGVQGMSLAGPQGGPSFCRVTITAGSPDLSAGSVIPSSATAGTAVTLSSTITNGPSAATGAAFTDLFQIANDSSGTGTTDIGTYANSALAANGSNSATLSYTFSSVGTSYVRACADKSSGANAGVIAESNESNNCGAWTAITVAGTPDLTGVSGSGVSITAGQTASLSGTVQNIGTGAAGSTFNNLFQITLANQVTVVDNVIRTAGPLAPSASQGVSGATSYTFSTPGTYYYRLCADLNSSWVGSVTESNEGNNCGAWSSITVADPNQPPTGYIDSASCTVNGWAYDPNTPAQNIPVHFYVNGPAGSGTFMGQTTTGGSRPDIAASPNAGWSFAIPSAYQDGAAHSIYAYGIDTTDGTGAHNAQLGFGTGSPMNFTCVAAAPDLTGVSGSGVSITAGQTASLSGTVQNIGTGAAGSTFNNLFQITLANQVTVVDNVIRTAGPLAPSASQGVSGATSYTFSTPGTYYYRLCADLNSSWVGSVTESNEGNNCGAWSSITVAAVVPPTPTCSLSANPPGVPSTLTWSSTNATTCTGGGFSTGGATAGTAPVGTAGSYTLSCSGAGGSCPVQSVTVGAAACSNPTPTISATPARIHAGDPVTISYSATGVNSCTIVGPGVSKSATVASCSVSPSTALVPAGTIQTQATYTITCDGVSKQTIVNVIPQFQEF